MTVRELISKLIETSMDADVVTTHCCIDHVNIPIEDIVEHTSDDLYYSYYHPNGVVILYDILDHN